MRADGKRWWAAPVARQLGLPALGFVATRPNWFPAGCMQAALAAPAIVKILAAYRRRITYGFSMGGYAAARFAAEVGAGVSIAIAPQSTIDPSETATHDRRFSRFHDPVLHAGMRMAPEHGAGRTYIIFDPREAADRWNADRIGGVLPDVVTVHARSTGHWTASALASSATSGAMFAGALAGDAAAIRAAVGGRRRVWARRPLVLARQLCLTRPGLALSLAEAQPVQGNETDFRAIFELTAEGFLRKGDLDGAESAALRAVSLTPDSSHAVAMLAEAALRKGQNERALVLARNSVDLAPNSAGAHFRLAAFLRRTGQPEVAEEVRLIGEALTAKR